MSTIRSPGFTLLELLVVMVIIGIIAAMATLSVGLATRENGTEKELQRIQDLLALASEEAVSQGREFGLTFYAKEYQFSAWDTTDPVNPHWKPLGDDAKPFLPGSFTPGTIVDLEIEGRKVKLAEEKPVIQEEKKSSDEADGDKSKPRQRSMTKNRSQPQIFMDSSGEISPFKLHLRPEIGAPGMSLLVEEGGKVEKVRDER